MAADVNDLTIKQVQGHWEVYINGEFFCTADSYLEAVREFYKSFK